jgi:hypothetical protein
MIYHILAYFFSLFRAWEIDHKGKMDVNGNVRGPIESVLSSVEIFLNCIILGYSIHFIISTDDKKLIKNHDLILRWIMVDNTLNFIQLAYVSFSNKMILNSEITKNMFSLYFFQQITLQKKEEAEEEEEWNKIICTTSDCSSVKSNKEGESPKTSAKGEPSASSVSLIDESNEDEDENDGKGSTKRMID